MTDKTDAIVGCLLGTAVGDALGLPFEMMSRQRQLRAYPRLEGHHFFFGKGMFSDDTQHSYMVAQALIASNADREVFARTLAWRFRLWLLTLPAGIGKATLLSILRLWMGVKPHKSGVFSAGNGPSMKSALIGVCYGHDTSKMCELVRASTVLTHTDPKAYFGALAVAVAADMASRREHVTPHEFFDRLMGVLSNKDAGEFIDLVHRVVQSVTVGRDTLEFADDLGLNKGISGYTYHTVPVVLYSWLRHQGDYRAAVAEVIRCGGDTDTTGAIVGAIMGAGVGKAGIPQQWRQDIIEWPATMKWIERVGCQLAEVCSRGVAQRPVKISFLGSLMRNIFFVMMVFAHLVRRLLPVATR
ncbi:ADP-ribosylglycohydrolase [Candidatus Magnetobacterium bavaricum]|uniref:ADP-ribosylglycohydrolase n=1 Tax=Candidatus Magnetobacterium bavaricum TaxID=29290 RepID=A0A0F3GZY6_9BACT|nr:ADP-ribosylglycohydrolase [Candidatus Magnetobacterium bavaricum]